MPKSYFSHEQVRSVRAERVRYIPANLLAAAGLYETGTRRTDRDHHLGCTLSYYPKNQPDMVRQADFLRAAQFGSGIDRTRRSRRRCAAVAVPPGRERRARWTGLAGAYQYPGGPGDLSREIGARARRSRPSPAASDRVAARRIRHVGRAGGRPPGKTRERACGALACWSRRDRITSAQTRFCGSAARAHEGADRLPEPYRRGAATNGRGHTVVATRRLWRCAACRVQVSRPPGCPTCTARLGGRSCRLPAMLPIRTSGPIAQDLSQLVDRQRGTDAILRGWSLGPYTHDELLDVVGGELPSHSGVLPPDARDAPTSLDDIVRATRRRNSGRWVDAALRSAASGSRISAPAKSGARASRRTSFTSTSSGSVRYWRRFHQSSSLRTAGTRIPAAVAAARAPLVDELTAGDDPRGARLRQARRSARARRQAPAQGPVPSVDRRAANITAGAGYRRLAEKLVGGHERLLPMRGFLRRGAVKFRICSWGAHCFFRLLAGHQRADDNWKRDFPQQGDS